MYKYAFTYYIIMRWSRKITCHCELILSKKNINLSKYFQPIKLYYLLTSWHARRFFPPFLKNKIKKKKTLLQPPRLFNFWKMIQGMLNTTGIEIAHKISLTFVFFRTCFLNQKARNRRTSLTIRVCERKRNGTNNQPLATVLWSTIVRTDRYLK